MIHCRFVSSIFYNICVAVLAAAVSLPANISADDSCAGREHQGRESVGLVLSGGGAKGIAHVGVIKALEENGIPVDYVAGTSMGAIVGSLYSLSLIHI